MSEGKLPPQSLELERGVLGSLLFYEGVLPLVTDILSPKSFYTLANKTIYECILFLDKKNIRPDILSVTQELKRIGKLNDVGGAYYVTQLTNNPSTQITYHAGIIQKKYTQRELIRICNETEGECYREDTECNEIFDKFEKQLTEARKSTTIDGGKSKTMQDLWVDIIDKNNIILNQNGITGVPTGYEQLDKVTGGWQQPDLIIIAARPAMGKTSLALCFARNAGVMYNKAGAIFSLEMSSLQLAARLFSLESGVPISSFLRKGVESERMLRIEKDHTQLINAPIFIDDTAGISLMELRSKARLLKRQKDIQWIIIDYLQLMAGSGRSGQNREGEVSEISRGLKGLAKELQIPIIALSQLSRTTETRTKDKRPILSDLRESGAIEQDADLVMFIHRPEYYDIKTYEDGSSKEGLAELIIAKHRNGALNTINLKFIGYLTKFISIDELTPYGTTTDNFTEPPF